MNAWYGRQVTGAGVYVFAVRSDAHPDGAIVAVDGTPDGAYSCATLDRDSRVVALDDLTCESNEVWYVEVRETSATPPATNLLAFTGFAQTPGTLLDEAAASRLGVSPADRIGSVRWSHLTGAVDQVYVEPQHRRAGVGTRLAVTAGCLAVARDWPRLWGDGQGTEEGERFVQALPFRDRVVSPVRSTALMAEPAGD
jgi:GNAT superfamily N-acetyltransferase